MFDKVSLPADGHKIQVKAGQLVVPPDPIVGVIWGDGVGPDVMHAALRVWDAAVQRVYSAQRKIAWMRLYAGDEALALYGQALPPDTLKAVAELKVAIKGPLAPPSGVNMRALCHKLDLYARVRPIKWYPGLPSPLREPQLVDTVVISASGADFYEWPAGSDPARQLAGWLSGTLSTPVDESAGLGLTVMTEGAVKRLVRRAIRYGVENGRTSLALVYKGSAGAFAEWGYEVARQAFGAETVSEAAAETPGAAGKLVIKDRLADVIFQELLLHPQACDVLVTSRWVGDYLVAAAEAEVGGVGIAPSVHFGDEVALFQASAASLPSYADMDMANPGGLILAGALLLEHIGWQEAAQAVRMAFVETIAQKILTYDLARLMPGAREVKTSEFASAVIRNL